MALLGKEFLQVNLCCLQLFMAKGAWHFRLTKKIVRLDLDTGDYPAFKAEADKQRVTVKDLLESYLKAKTRELKN